MSRSGPTAELDPEVLHRLAATSARAKTEPGSREERPTGSIDPEQLRGLRATAARDDGAPPAGRDRQTDKMQAKHFQALRDRAAALGEAEVVPIQPAPDAAPASAAEPAPAVAETAPAVAEEPGPAVAMPPLDPRAPRPAPGRAGFNPLAAAITALIAGAIVLAVALAR